MKKQLTSVVLLLSIHFLYNHAFSQDIGSILCWHYAEIHGGHDYAYNQSILKRNFPDDNTHWSDNLQWWENIVEEIDYSGMDYVALLSRGNQPNAPDRGNGNPKHIPKLIEAMQAREITSFKIAIFDDVPNSWTGSKNWNESGGTHFSSTNPKFDLSNTDNYKYIWDYNLRQVYQHVPDEMRYKIEGRPVIFFWNLRDTWFTNIEGSLKPILDHIRTQCQAEFGFNPFIIVQHTWFEGDSQLSKSDVDAVHGWFSSMGGTSWTLIEENNYKIGVAIPGLRDPDAPDHLAPAMGTNDNSTRLRYGLDNTVGAGARTTLIEGFTNAAEAAAIWRSNDQGTYTFYDYPNQRLNVVRSYTSNPFPEVLKVEAEACDFNYDLTPENSGGAYLYMGDLDVKKSIDIYGGWYVTDTEPTEWMEWRELPLLADTRFDLRYKSTAASSVKISVDGIDLPTASLPSTDGKWSTMDIGTVSLPENGWHTVRLTIVSGSPAINYFNRTTSTAPIDNPGYGGDASVVIASPSDNASFNFATGFTLKVDASHLSGFEWMRLWAEKENEDPKIYETLNDGPWEFNVMGLSPGTYTFFVRARDNDGGTTNSEIITVTLYEEGNDASVVISSPSDNSSLDAATDFKLTVDASYPLGFEWMRLWANKDNEGWAVLSLINQSPWEFNVAGLTAGTYSFYVRARDKGKGTTDSEKITVTLHDDLPSAIKDSYSQNIVSIYPNPVYDKSVGVEFSLETLSKVSMSVMDMNGALVYQPVSRRSFEPGTHKLDIPLVNIQPGIYFMQIAFDGRMQTHKIVVM